MRRLRPVADLFEEAFELYRRNFALLLGVLAVFQLPLIAVQVPFLLVASRFTAPAGSRFPFGAPGDRGDVAFPPGLPVDATTLAAFVAGFFVLFSAAIVLAQAGAAGVSYATARLHAGERVTARDVVGEVARRLPSLLGLTVLLFAVTIGATAVFALVLAVVTVAFASAGASAVATMIAVTTLASIVLIVLMFFFLLRFALVIQALAVDRLGAFAALGRSWHVVRGSMWRTFGVIVVTSMAAGLITLVAFPLFGAGLPGVVGGDVGPIVLATVVGGLVQLLVAPLVPAVMTLLYLDLRDRAAGR